jgi:hypothetical protein
MVEAERPIELGTAKLVYPIWPKIFRSLPMLVIFGLNFGWQMGLAAAALYFVALRAIEVAPKTFGRWAPVAFLVALTIYFLNRFSIVAGTYVAIASGLALELMMVLGVRFVQFVSTIIAHCARDEDVGIRELLKDGDVSFEERAVNRRLQLVVALMFAPFLLLGLTAGILDQRPFLYVPCGLLLLGAVLFIAQSRRAACSVVIKRDHVIVTYPARFRLQPVTVYVTQVRRLKVAPFMITARGRKGRLFVLQTATFSPYDLGLLVQFLTGRRDEDGDTDINATLAFCIALFAAILVLGLVLTTMLMSA